MERAIKLRVTVGKDHVVKLPSDFPEGPAEVIIITAGKSAPAGGDNELSIWADVGEGEYDAFSSAIHDLRASDRLRTADE